MIELDNENNAVLAPEIPLSKHREVRNLVEFLYDYRRFYFNVEKIRSLVKDLILNKEFSFLELDVRFKSCGTPVDLRVVMNTFEFDQYIFTLVHRNGVVALTVSGGHGFISDIKLALTDAKKSASPDDLDLLYEIADRLNETLVPHEVSSDKKPLPLLWYLDNDLNLLNSRLKLNLRPDFFDNYNDETTDAFVRTVHGLRNSSKGMYLIYGPPGTGKTNWLKRMTLAVPERKFIFIPGTFIKHLADPSLIDVLTSNPNSVLVIEDAENFLSKRVSGQTDPCVANVLNLSDGILSDLCNTSIVCTFNCPIDEIDPAFRRAGRCLVEHAFKPLSPQKAQALCNKLGVDYNQLPQDSHNTDPDGNYQSVTVAEIYKLAQLKLVNQSSINSEFRDSILNADYSKEYRESDGDDDEDEEDDDLWDDEEDDEDDGD